ncbi:hypothetical protein FDV58_24865 [Bradyrhizobium elkanii]|uniref:Uncharacterized protein n=1 Tax=Bradyrhizobium elkanii TaxID=29448 RepID=A0A4U6S2R0_BRAEL|nr:hypothetical protein [Bradyrhizobium elkanii]TKV78936.1 hypothetical protein FDV58_24865 [Bradyrhizobium elkanii]
MLDTIDNATGATEGRKGLSFGLGLFAVGHCLSTSWTECSGAVACTGVVVKSAAMAFPPLNFAYVIWLSSKMV